MKKVFFVMIIAIMAIVFSSCTEQGRARSWGGSMTINVDRGYKLVEVTWKDDNNLWYLIEPMEDGYVPKTKIFKESSGFGVMEGVITFHEKR
jgi:hypothetical protein